MQDKYIEVERIDDVLPRKYKEYGVMVNTSRAFPSIKDGLKFVSRRVLYTSYLEAKNKLVKSAKVVGTTMAKFHPHGDASIYETLVGLVNSGFYLYQGNFGSLSGLEPPGDKTLGQLASAMRYTEVRLHPHILDVAFSLIDFVPFDYVEMDDEKEPLFLPVKFPLCYMAPRLNKCMGFGINATFPNYRLEDLKRRLAWLLGLRKTEPVIKPYYDKYVQVLSKDKELRELLKTGKGAITFKPTTKLIGKKEIQILARPINLNLRRTLFRLFQEDIEQGRITINDLSVENTDVRITLYSSKVSLSNIIKKVDDALTTKVTYSCVFVSEDNKPIYYGVDDLLLRTYNQFAELWRKKVNFDCAKIEEQIRDLELIAKMKPAIREIMSKRYQWARQVEEISKKSSVNKSDVERLLSKYRIKTLLTVSTDTKHLKEKLKETKAKKDDVNSLYNF